MRMVGFEVAFMDIRANPLNNEQILDLLASHGEETLVNRKSMTWRNLDAVTRMLPSHTLLAKNPTLIKRPVIFTKDGSFVGWTREVKKAFNL